jgi:tetratricopeptide (TPR) repeat protein
MGRSTEGSSVMMKTWIARTACACMICAAACGPATTLEVEEPSIPDEDVPTSSPDASTEPAPSPGCPGDILACALEALEMIEHEKERDQAMAVIAEVYAATGHAGWALEVVDRIEDDEIRQDGLLAVSAGLAASGYCDEIGEIFSDMKEEQVRESALTRAAVCHGEKGEEDRALEILELIGAGKTRDTARARTALGLVKAGLYEAAGEELAKVQSTDLKDLYLRSSVEAAVEAGAAQEALTLSMMIEDAATRAWTHGDVVAALAKKGMMQEALELAESIPATHPMSLALVKVALAHAEAGEEEQALELASQILENVKAMTDAEDSDDVLFEAVAIYGLAGEYDKARKLCLKTDYQGMASICLHNLVFQIIEDGDHALAFEMVAAHTDEWGMMIPLDETVEELALEACSAGRCDLASGVTGPIKNPDDLAIFLSSAATGFIEAGKPEAALGVVKHAKKKSIKCILYDDIATSLAGAGHFDQAIEVVGLLEEALKKTKKQPSGPWGPIESSATKSKVRCLEFSQLASEGKIEEAMQMLDAGANDCIQARFPAEIAAAYLVRGEWETALSFALENSSPDDLHYTLASLFSTSVREKRLDLVMLVVLASPEPEVRLYLLRRFIDLFTANSIHKMNWKPAAKDLQVNDEKVGQRILQLLDSIP